MPGASHRAGAWSLPYRSPWRSPSCSPLRPPLSSYPHAVAAGVDGGAAARRRGRRRRGLRGAAAGGAGGRRCLASGRSARRRERGRKGKREKSERETGRERDCGCLASGRSVRRRQREKEREGENCAIYIPSPIPRSPSLSSLPSFLHREPFWGVVLAAPPPRFRLFIFPAQPLTLWRARPQRGTIQYGDIDQVRAPRGPLAS